MEVTEAVATNHGLKKEEFSKICDFKLSIGIFVESYTK